MNLPNNSKVKQVLIVNDIIKCMEKEQKERPEVMISFLDMHCSDKYGKKSSLYHYFKEIGWNNKEITKEYDLLCNYLREI